MAAYNYDPFELPIQGLKIPEWVNSTEAPVDAFAIADKIRNQQQAEKANEITSLAKMAQLSAAMKQAEKVLKTEEASKVFNQWRQGNTNASPEEMYNKAAEYLGFGTGDVGAGIELTNAGLNLAKQKQSEKLQKLSTVSNLARTNPALARAAFDSLDLGSEMPNVTPGMFDYVGKPKSGKSGDSKISASDIKYFEDPITKAIIVGSKKDPRIVQAALGNRLRMADEYADTEKAIPANDYFAGRAAPSPVNLREPHGNMQTQKGQKVNIQEPTGGFTPLGLFGSRREPPKRVTIDSKNVIKAKE